MTLTRPAYRATITNHTRGWTRTVTAGDTPDPELPVQLLDGLQVSWQSQDSRPFTQLDPSSVSFTIAAKSVGDLLDVDYDDEVSVVLERPTAGAPLPIARVFGPVSDLSLNTSVRDLLQDGHTAVTHAVTVVDPLSLLDTPVTIDEVAATSVEGFFDLEGATARALALASLPSARDTTYIAAYPWHFLIADNEPVRELVEKVHNGVRDLTERAIPILRAAHRWDVPPSNYEFVGTGPYRYFTDYWTIDTATPLPLFRVVAAGRIVGVQRTATNDAQSAVHVLSASLVDGTATWIKNRRRGLDTQLTMTAPGDAAQGEPTLTLTSATAPADPTTQRTNVELTTGHYPDPDVYRGIPGLKLALQLQLDARRPTRAYGLPSASLRASIMTDAEWDRHCTRLVPAMLPADSVFGRPVVLVDVADDLNPAGYSSAYVQWGATLTLARGDVVTQLQLTPRPLAHAATTAATVNGIKTGALAATRVRAQATGLYLDPRLTYDDLKLATL